MEKIINAILFFVVISFVSCSKKDGENNLMKFDHPNTIFIAHAGGKIDDKIYTNSLEALNHSYSLGCRMIELDILETSDGKFVAVHDWISFKENSNYTGTKRGAIPLTENEVLTSKIYGQYTPLNIERINEWFTKHPDAILVTDKVNSPRRWVDSISGFKFPNRCIMELFSWNAVDEANEVGITPMVSGNLIFTFESERNRLKRFIKKTNVINKLKKKKIKYLTFSHRKIEGNKKIIKKLKNKDFKIFVYHVNDSKKNTEKYILNSYFDEYIDGMYADDLKLLDSLKRNNTE